jgi:2-keto-4-pentenoate hydratase/2-oxohepta-3-ene-1,7-dioic acid hydratase in catechol pathway
VGMARNPAVFLQPGDQFEVEIDRIGLLCNSVVGPA